MNKFLVASLFTNLILVALCLHIKIKEGKEMAVIYVALIIKGLRTYASVPAVLKPQVKELLLALELDSLITE